MGLSTGAFLKSPRFSIECPMLHCSYSGRFCPGCLSGSPPSFERDSVHSQGFAWAKPPFDPFCGAYTKAIRKKQGSQEINVIFGYLVRLTHFEKVSFLLAGNQWDDDLSGDFLCFVSCKRPSGDFVRGCWTAEAFHRAELSYLATSFGESSALKKSLYIRGFQPQ